MDLADEYVIYPMSVFIRNSRMLVQKCTKPNYRDFTASGMATLMGFVVMGFIGFAIKLIFIPINNVIMGQ